MRRIYLDNAASTPIISGVKETMLECMELTGNPSSVHSHGRELRAIIEKSRRVFAKQFNTSIGEFFFTSGATESNNAILCSLVYSGKVKHIISSPIEHPCILKTLNQLEKSTDLELSWLDVDIEGNIDLNQLESLLKLEKGKTLVSLMFINNEIGTVHNVKEIGNLCQANDALFHCDGVQAVGHYEFDLSALPVNYMSFSAHKFHGPKGIGMMYICGDHIIDPFIRGGGQERNMRAGTENPVGIAGAAKALELCYENLHEWEKQITANTNYLRQALINLDLGIEFNGPPADKALYSTVNILLPEHPKSSMMTMLLDIEGISVSGGSACSSGTEQGSHVIACIKPETTRRSLRLSLSHLNTREELEYFITKIEKIYNS